MYRGSTFRPRRQPKGQPDCDVIDLLTHQLHEEWNVKKNIRWTTTIHDFLAALPSPILSLPFALSPIFNS